MKQIKNIPKLMQPYCQKTMLQLCLFGISIGLPAVLTWHALNLWLYELGYSKAIISMLAIIGIPYSIKPVFAYIIDNLCIPKLTQIFGHYLAWSIISQICIANLLIILAITTESVSLQTTLIICFAITTCSAINQIALHSHRIQSISLKDTAFGVAIMTNGYRVGWLIGSAGALYLAEVTSWQNTYFFMAGLLIINMLLSLMANPKKPLIINKTVSIDSSILTKIFKPYLHFIHNHPYWIWLCLLLFTINIGDNLINGMATLFYRDIGFSKIDIANISKLLGMLCTSLGCLFSAPIINKQANITRTLYQITLLHALTHICLIILAITGKQPFILAINVILSHVTAGIKSTTIISYITQKCQNTSSPASLYSGMMSVKNLSLTLFTMLSGFLVQTISWPLFFLLSTLIVIPSLVIIYKLEKNHRPKYSKINLSPIKFSN